MTPSNSKSKYPTTSTRSGWPADESRDWTPYLRAKKYGCDKTVISSNGAARRPRGTHMSRRVIRAFSPRMYGDGDGDGG